MGGDKSEPVTSCCTYRKPKAVEILFSISNSPTLGDVWSCTPDFILSLGAKLIYVCGLWVMVYLNKAPQ